MLGGTLVVLLQKTLSLIKCHSNLVKRSLTSFILDCMQDSQIAPELLEIKFAKLPNFIFLLDFREMLTDSFSYFKTCNNLCFLLFDCDNECLGALMFH